MSEVPEQGHRPDERIDVDGEVIVPLDEHDVRDAVRELLAARAAALTVIVVRPGQRGEPDVAGNYIIDLRVQAS